MLFRESLLGLQTCESVNPLNKKLTIFAYDNENISMHHVQKISQQRYHMIGVAAIRPSCENIGAIYFKVIETLFFLVQSLCRDTII